MSFSYFFVQFWVLLPTLNLAITCTWVCICELINKECAILFPLKSLAIHLWNSVMHIQGGNTKVILTVKKMILTEASDSFGQKSDSHG